MASSTALDFRTRGTVSPREDGTIAFCPAGTNYELHLVPEPAGVPGAGGGLVEGTVRCEAGKLWTVPSGGSFIEPIAGRPRIVQGRVRYVDEQVVVVQAGGLIVVELPAEEEALGLAEGPVAVGRLVNVTVRPGARLQLSST